MDAWAYQILKMGEFGTIALSWVVLFASAAIGLAFSRRAFRLGRAAYFLTMGLSFLLVAMTSLFVLRLYDAIRNDDLTVVVALIIGALVPIGIFIGICAAARSRDAFDTPKKWFLAFIPFANLFLLFAPPREPRQPGAPSLTGSIALVVVGFAMMGAGRGLSQWVSGQVNQASVAAESDELLQKKLALYDVQSFGLEASLQEAAKAIAVPAKVDGVTTLKAVEVDKEIFRYVYEISYKDAVLSTNWRHVMMSRWCKSPDIGLFMDIGATVEGKFLSQEGQQLGELKANPALCDEWRLQFDKTMQEAARAIKGPAAVDEATTLTGADYKDGTFTYYYTVSNAPADDGWKAYMKGMWCQTDQFKKLMDFGLNVRGVYSTEGNAPIGEIVVSSEICGI